MIFQGAFSRAGVLCLAIHFLSQAANGEVPVEVSHFGDLRRIAIEGAKTFSRKEIQKEIQKQLWRDLEFQIASAPHSPLAAYRELLTDKVREGYRYAGFPDVQVTTELDRPAKRLKLKIAEGRRLMAGKIQIKGAKAISTDALIKRLTTERVPEETAVEYYDRLKITGEDRITKPAPKIAPVAGSGNTPTKASNDSDTDSKSLWEPGKPAHFDHQTLHDDLHKGIAEALADLGYFAADFSADIVAAPKAESATLEINIDKEGPRAIVDQIEVSGTNLTVYVRF